MQARVYPSDNSAAFNHFYPRKFDKEMQEAFQWIHRVLQGTSWNCDTPLFTLDGTGLTFSCTIHSAAYIFSPVSTYNPIMMLLPRNYLSLLVTAIRTAHRSVHRTVHIAYRSVDNLFRE
eukprot:GFKZ01007245.1.p4 GENE.GFKZ01007245.1~~GFKZ01007245.1.p4  ORF type:complete len:119 (-),score=3.74 GFKZ01007245.1:1449-1805(-)